MSRYEDDRSRVVVVQPLVHLWQMIVNAFVAMRTCCKARLIGTFFLFLFFSFPFSLD